MRSQPALFALAAAAVLIVAGTPARSDEAGEKAFKKHCGTCHTVEAGKNRVGPSLAGIFGRSAGQVEGFKYSDVNKTSNVQWSETTLDPYLKDPKTFMPGNKMVFNGVKNDQERADIIRFLKEGK